MLCRTVVIGTSSTCTDSFTTATALPYSLSSPWSLAPAPSSTSPLPLTITPATSLLRFLPAGSAAAAAAPAAAIQTAYGMLGVSDAASVGLTGPLDALRLASPASRLVGVRMLLADAALSSAVVIAAGALAAFPAGSLPACGTADARADAVQKALARLATRTSASSPSLDLTSTTLVSEAVAAAAMDACGGTVATLTQADVARVLSSAAAAYAATAGADFAALSATAPNAVGGNAVVSRAVELTALPLEAVSAAARIAAVTAARLPAALANLGADANAVSSLVSDWTNQLGAAAVATDAMAARLGLPALASPAAARLSVRSSGVLTQCQVSARSVYLGGAALRATTDITGVATLSSMPSALVTVPSGCRDAALSVNGRTVTTKVGLQVLLPAGVDTAVINAAAALATAFFFISNSAASSSASASASSTAPRHILPSDFQAVYAYFGIGAAGAADALPANTDFIRQGWGSGTALDARAYLLNARLMSALGPTCEFVSALLKGARTPEQVAYGFVGQMARDLQAGALKLDSLLSTVADTVVQSSAILSQLDTQVTSAAAAGQPVESVATAAVRSAAQVAAVQQGSLATTLGQLAAAATSGDTTAVTQLTTTLSTNFTGEALMQQVNTAAVDTSAITTGTGVAQSSGTASSGTPVDTSTIAMAAGVAVGGAVLVFGVAVVAIVVVKRRRARSAFAFRDDRVRSMHLGAAGEEGPAPAIVAIDYGAQEEGIGFGAVDTMGIVGAGAGAAPLPEWHDAPTALVALPPPPPAPLVPVVPVAPALARKSRGAAAGPASTSEGGAVGKELRWRPGLTEQMHWNPGLQERMEGGEVMGAPPDEETSGSGQLRKLAARGPRMSRFTEAGGSSSPGGFGAGHAPSAPGGSVLAAMSSVPAVGMPPPPRRQRRRSDAGPAASGPAAGISPTTTAAVAAAARGSASHSGPITRLAKAAAGSKPGYAPSSVPHSPNLGNYSPAVRAGRTSQPGSGAVGRVSQSGSPHILPRRVSVAGGGSGAASPAYHSATVVPYDAPIQIQPGNDPDAIQAFEQPAEEDVEAARPQPARRVWGRM
ncbi:hypothetical protein HYH02_008383 [Chlamydomonas schloesseri]|uniref:Uncharacterized protein n=1 Tax=Chlamydomonas schloesseri TaxID=2026947 RepID=A0A835WGC7_9CHLO|nr:hypothetical protein HYH02_008383 [Chlamydomonas schloesseri]|eukprot:KAG2446823.1 hypothetical protein HYH02_008383 [Chlamydomonas schloesseri]